MLLLACLIWKSTLAFAHHPNEGSLSLEAIIQEALTHNLEIKEAEANVNSFSAISKKNRATFFPEISLEGGPLKTKFDSEKHNGTSIYGKAEWNIFRGGKDSALVSKGNLEEKTAKARYEYSKARISREAAKAYYEMLFILESIDLKLKAIEMNRDQMKLAKAKKTSGFTSEADVIEFELREATLNSDLKQLQQAQNSKSRDLAILLGRGNDSSLVAVLGHLSAEIRIPKKESLIAIVSLRNQELSEAKYELESSEIDLRVVRSEFLPKVDLLAKYGKLSNEEKVFDEKNNYSVGVTLNLPIFSGFSSLYGFRAAQYAKEKSEIQISKQNNIVLAEAEQLYSQLISLRERLDLEEKTLLRSEEYYKITTGEYRRGIKNSPDMVTASERLIDARIRNLEFRKEYQITLIELLGMAGLEPNSKEFF